MLYVYTYCSICTFMITVSNWYILLFIANFCSWCCCNGLDNDCSLVYAIQYMQTPYRISRNIDRDFNLAI